MFKTITAICLAISLNLISMPVAAQSVSCNANGYVLGAEDPPPAYLGKSCDVFLENFGSGTWCWTPTGIVVDFPRGASQLERRALPTCPAAGIVEVPCNCADHPLPSGYLPQ